MSEAPPTGSNRTSERLRRALFRRGFSPVAVGLWALATSAFLVASFPLFAALAQPGTSSSDGITEDFNAGHVARPDQLLSVDGFRAGDEGWYLDPGTSGRLVYRIPTHPGASIGLNLWVKAPTGVNVTVVGRAEGQPDAILSTNTTLVGYLIDLPPRFATAPNVDIEISARNATGAQVLVIDQIVTYAVQGSRPKAPPFYAYLGLGALAAMLTLATIRRRRHAFVIAAGMGVVVAITCAGRMLALFGTTVALDPDAVGYRTYADRFQWWPPFDNGLFSGNFAEREPLFLMVVHAYFQVLGSSDFHLRVVSATLSIAVVIVSVIAARRRLSWMPALAIGLLLAISVPLIRESVRGLRFELEMLVLLLLYIALDRGPSKHPLRDAVLIGVLGAAMVLTRTYYLPVFVVAVAIAFFARYRPLRRAAGLATLAVLIMVGAAAAHRVGLYEHHQDPFWDTGRYTRWNANIEKFAYHRPLPHAELFPTLAEYQQNGPYVGPPISSSQYFLVIHSPYEFARDSLAGARQMFETIDGFLATKRLGLAQLGQRVDLAVRWLVLLGLMGMLFRAWRHPRLALIPVLVLSWLGLTAFLFDHSLLERYRHTWQTIPLALIAAGWLVESVVRIAMRRFHLNRDYVRWYTHARANVDLALFPIAVGLPLVQARLSPRLLLADAALVAIAIGLLAYRRPAIGTVAMVLAVSVSAAQAAATAAAALALVAVIARERPTVHSLRPVLVVAPLALAISIAAGRLTSASLLLAATMLCVVATVAVVARQPAGRTELIWWLAGIGPLAGIAFLLGPVAAAPATALAPVGVLASAWLFLHGERWGLPLGLVNLAIVILVEPLFAWLGVVVALAWLVRGSQRLAGARRRMAAAGAAVVVLGLLAGGASLSATSPTADAAWQTQLATAGASIEQHITVDRAGDDAVWIYASRASGFSDYPVRLVVNGLAITNDLNSYLPTGQLAWVDVPLPIEPRQGDSVVVQVIPTGNPNPIDRYIDIGGAYSRIAGVSSLGTQAGTYLIVLGDDSLPLAPGGLPEPMVHRLWQLPMGAGLPGEFGAPLTAREQAGTWQIWGKTLTIALRNPLGLGTSGLSPALNQVGGGFGPGLSARDEYLQAAADWGLAGLAGLCVLLGGAAWFASRSGDSLAIALLVLTGVTMVGESLLLDPAGAAGTWVVVGLCLTAGAASRSTSRA